MCILHINLVCIFTSTIVGMELVRREVERLSAQHSRYLDPFCLLICSIVIMSRSDSLLRHYIANAWLAKLDTVAEPGPIDNSSVICQHGGVRFNRHIVFILDYPS